MASANVKEFTAANWQKEVVESDVPVLVDFWAPWCGPCRQLAPIIERVADQFAGKIKVGKLNTDDNQDLAVQYRISAIPQVFLFKGGAEPVERLVGFQEERNLVKIINGLLAPNSPERGYCLSLSPFAPRKAEAREQFRPMIDLLRKYQRAIGKPGIKPEDIDAELGRAIMKHLKGIELPNPHRFDIDKIR